MIKSQYKKWFVVLLLICILLMIVTNEWNIFNAYLVIIALFLLFKFKRTLLRDLSFLFLSITFLLLFFYLLILKNWYPPIVDILAHYSSGFLIYTILYNLFPSEKKWILIYLTIFFGFIYEIIELILFSFEMNNLSWDLLNFYQDMCLNIFGCGSALLISNLQKRISKK